jgi:hypothetical protein
MDNPSQPGQAPDPARSYERAKPGAESGMGRMDNNKATPTDRPDAQRQGIKNAQDPSIQVNGEEVVDNRENRSAAMPAPAQPDHSMLDEEPTGWDMAPTDIHDPERQRQPKTEGKGGTP